MGKPAIHKWVLSKLKSHFSLQKVFVTQTFLTPDFKILSKLLKRVQKNRMTTQHLYIFRLVRNLVMCGNSSHSRATTNFVKHKKPVWDGDFHSHHSLGQTNLPSEWNASRELSLAQLPVNTCVLGSISY